jgi:ParB family transcriptional regulator, chromosome partitioning protein
MTSDKFARVRVADIVVEERQRKDLGDLSGLADSIEDLEQLQPIVVTRPTAIAPKPKLVIGGRRLHAHIARGLEFVDCLFTDEVDPIKLMEMEFHENEHRLGYTWQEQCDAIRDYHAARLVRHGKWTQKQTAEGLKVSTALVCKYLGISGLDAKGYTELKEKNDLSTAWAKAKRINAHLADADDEIVSDLVDVHILGRTITERPKTPIIAADFCEWAKTYDGSKFNFLHCDFPYGINTDKRQQGNAIAVHDGYDDSEENYWRLLGVLCDNLGRICEPSAHIMFWFSMHYYDKTLKFFAENSDFIIDEFPLVWMKSDGAGILPDRITVQGGLTKPACLVGGVIVRLHRRSQTLMLLQLIANLITHPRNQKMS